MIFRYGGGSVSVKVDISASFQTTVVNKLVVGPTAPTAPFASGTISLTFASCTAFLEPISGTDDEPDPGGETFDVPHTFKLGYKATVAGFGHSDTHENWVQTFTVDANSIKTAGITFTTSFIVNAPTIKCFEEMAASLAIIDAPFPAQVTLSQIFDPNSDGLAKCGGASVSGTQGGSPDYGLSINFYATAKDTGSGSWSASPATGPGEPDFFQPSDPSHSGTATDSLGSASGSANNLTLSANRRKNNRAAMNSVWYPLKSFALSGVVRAMESAYPDALMGTCSKFLGDTGTNTDMPISGGAFSISYAQRKGQIDGAYYGDGSVNGILALAAINEWQPVQASIKGLGINSLAAVGDDPRATRLLMRGRTFAGITLAKSNVTVDAGTTLTATGAWAGSWEPVSGGSAPSIAGGGVSFSGAAQRAFTHDVSFTGSRHLRLTLKSSVANAPFSLGIGGKSWSAKAGGDTSAFAQIDIDLAAENSETATTSTHDAKWPLQRNDDLTGDDLPLSEGAFFGGQRVGSLTLTGASSVSFIVQKIELVTKGALTASAVPTFYRGIVQYRSGSPVGIDEGWPTQQYPDRHFGTEGGGTSTYLARRGLLLNADGVQMEQEDSLYQINTPPGEGADPSLIATQLRIIDLVDNINRVNANGTILNPGYVAVSSKPYPATGCDIDLPDFDACYLNEERPAAYLYGAGAMFTHDDGWSYGFDKDLGAIGQAQQCFDSIEWYPGCGDFFGFGGNPTSGPGSGTVQLRAAAILRGAGHGLTLKANKKPTTGRVVSLLQGTPAPGLMVSQGKSKVNGFYKMSAGPFAKTVQPGVVKGIGESVSFSDLYGRKRQRVVLVGDACLDLLAQDDHYFPFTPQFSDPTALPYENISGLADTKTSGQQK